MQLKWFKGMSIKNVTTIKSNEFLNCMSGVLRSTQKWLMTVHLNVMSNSCKVYLSVACATDGTKFPSAKQCQNPSSILSMCHDWLVKSHCQFPTQVYILVKYVIWGVC